MCVNPMTILLILIHFPARLVLIRLFLIRVSIGPQWPPLSVIVFLVLRILLPPLILLLFLSWILIRLLRFFCVVAWGRFRRSPSGNTRLCRFTL